ncbi:MAG TPA: hypothetical protein VGB97_04005 [Candidatus Paceibacterota bacterium]|jgi:hypothetical protein
MRKRTLIISASIIVILGLVAGAYFLFADSGELTATDDPFGGTGSGLVSEEGPVEISSGAGDEFAPRLIRITDRPVAEGMVAIPRISTTTQTVETASGTPALVEVEVRDTEARFIDRASGNIYRYLKEERSLVRISNKTLPGVQRVSWLPGGSMAYARFAAGTPGAEQVATYVLPESGEGGFFLEQNLAAAQAVGSSTLFTMLSGTAGSVGSVARADGTNARTLFTSLLSSIIVHPTQGDYFAHTKASVFRSGYAFRISTANGAFTRILGPLAGLSILPSPAGNLVLYSYIDRGTLRLAVFDTATRQATALPVATLPEKCTWAPDSGSVYCAVPKSLPRGLPDFWYQGAVTFADRIWEIDMGNRLATLVIDPSAVADVSIDAIALTTDPGEDVLLFTDKHNGALWLYDL